MKETVINFLPLIIWLSGFIVGFVIMMKSYIKEGSITFYSLSSAILFSCLSWFFIIFGGFVLHDLIIWERKKKNE